MSQQSNQNDIKDVIDGVKMVIDFVKDYRMLINHRERMDALTKAIAALTTLSEDNAAMKLEIERLKDTP